MFYSKPNHLVCINISYYAISWVIFAVNKKKDFHTLVLKIQLGLFKCFALHNVQWEGKLMRIYRVSILVIYKYLGI